MCYKIPRVIFNIRITREVHLHISIILWLNQYWATNWWVWVQYFKGVDKHWDHLPYKSSSNYFNHCWNTFLSIILHFQCLLIVYKWKPHALSLCGEYSFLSIILHFQCLLIVYKWKPHALSLCGEYYKINMFLTFISCHKTYTNMLDV